MENKSITDTLNLLIRTDKMHKKLFETKFSNIGVYRSQHKILMYLAQNNKCSSQKEIAEKFCISPAAVAVLLKKLEANGWIEKTVFDQDNRVNNVKITDKGINLIENTKIQAQEIENNIFNEFSQEEINAFCRCLEKMSISIQRYLSDENI